MTHSHPQRSNEAQSIKASYAVLIHLQEGKGVSQSATNPRIKSVRISACQKNEKYGIPPRQSGECLKTAPPPPYLGPYRTASNSRCIYSDPSGVVESVFSVASLGVSSEAAKVLVITALIRSYAKLVPNSVKWSSSR